MLNSLSLCARTPRGICTHKSPHAYIWHTQRAHCLVHVCCCYWLQAALQIGLKKFHCNWETQSLAILLIFFMYQAHCCLTLGDKNFCSLTPMGLSKEVLFILGKQKRYFHIPDVICLPCCTCKKYHLTQTTPSYPGWAVSCSLTEAACYFACIFSPKYRRYGQRSWS